MLLGASSRHRRGSSQWFQRRVSDVSGPSDLNPSSLLTTTTYAIAYFLPIILLDGMGFSLAASQCLVAPPWILAAIFMGVSGWVGDKFRFRGPVLIFNSLISIMGLALLGFHHINGVRYFGD